MERFWIILKQRLGYIFLNNIVNEVLRECFYVNKNENQNCYNFFDVVNFKDKFIVYIEYIRKENLKLVIRIFIQKIR